MPRHLIDWVRASGIAAYRETAVDQLHVAKILAVDIEWVSKGWLSCQGAQVVQSLQRANTYMWMGVSDRLVATIVCRRAGRERGRERGREEGRERERGVTVCVVELT